MLMCGPQDSFRHYCDVCGGRYRSKAGLATHQADQHGAAWEAVCDQCGAGFTSGRGAKKEGRQKLLRHRRHCGDPPAGLNNLHSKVEEVSTPS